MDWFDCNCGFGVPAKPFGMVFAAAAELVDELDFCGVGEALVFHTAQQFESPLIGNRLVIAEIAGACGETGRRLREACVGGVHEPRPRARLHSTWAILPPQTDCDVATFLDDMKRRGVKALRAYPEENRYLLNGITFGPLLEELVARRIPLFVGPQWHTVAGLLGEFPELTLVVINHGDWGDDRFFRPLIERYRRLHLDTSNYQLERGLSDFVRKYGPDRLLYGSGAPDFQMGTALLTLAQADMAEEAKAAIAGANLRRLLGEVRL